jgi:hypothetical protein
VLERLQKFAQTKNKLKGEDLEKMPGQGTRHAFCAAAGLPGPISKSQQSHKQNDDATAQAKKAILLFKRSRVTPQG